MTMVDERLGIETSAVDGSSSEAAEASGSQEPSAEARRAAGMAALLGMRETPFSSLTTDQQDDWSRLAARVSLFY